ncbi:DUF2974 domain-containing protein [Paenibacillus sp. GSMTC-2017]|uniref:Mbeg1-like protein n=1 Tax=Paenibacillus sp. GSMTC-2017 TaxID=2794350 RepID=UPI0018D5FDD5|nr:Mbeg1-like protein [Paenibacillus sp. GSMTC-2017]MBH5320065.1 DUF2974 domain-containing protein [Paenibacillus sp. GSMTC-2017]
MSSINEVDLKKLSQLVYLDVLKSDGNFTELSRLYSLQNKSITLAQLSEYFLSNEKGKALIEERFGEKLNGQNEATYWFNLLKEISENKEMRDWQIKNVKPNTEKGFSAFTIQTDKNDPSTQIIAFRGSEPMDRPEHWNDWSNNLKTMYLLQAPQQEEAAAYVNKLLSDNPTIKSLYLTGHSLGGNLALYSGITLSAEDQKKLVTATTFNAPGFNRDVLTTYQQSIANLNNQGKLTEYRNAQDIVPALFHNPSAGVYVQSTFSNTDYLGSHSLFATAMNADGTGFLLDSDQSFKLIPQKVQQLTQAAESLPYDVKAMLVEEIDKIKTEGFDLVRAMSVYQEVKPELKTLIDELGAAVAVFAYEYVRYDLLDMIEDKLLDARDTGVNLIKAGVSNGMNIMETWINGKIETAQLPSSWKQNLQSTISGMFTGMEQRFNDLLDRVVAWHERTVRKWIDICKQAVTRIVSAVKDTATSIWGKAKAFIADMKDFVEKKVDDIEAAAYKAGTLLAIGVGNVQRGSKLLVNMHKMEELERKLRRKEEAILTVIAEIIKRADYLTEQTNRGYKETNVQTKLRNVIAVRDKLRKESVVLGERIKKLADGVKEANALYNQMEKSLKSTIMRSLTFR